jgi:hypothetical protein
MFRTFGCNTRAQRQTPKAKEQLISPARDDAKRQGCGPCTARITLVLTGFALISLVAAPKAPAGQQSCTGKYKAYARPSPAELNEILKKHGEWVKSWATFGRPFPIPAALANDPRRANLCNSDLDGERLSYANLEGADLRGAHLDRVDFTGTNLALADLTGAHLVEAKLTGTDLTEADLDGAELDGAKLHEANLTRANLENADLTAARLMNANLYLARLQGADLSYSDVAYSYLDFYPDSPPKIFPGIGEATNLPLVTFHDSPAALIKLKLDFKMLGLRSQENQIIYAIMRGELNRTVNGRFVHSSAERLFNTVLFDWTYRYGMKPLRPVLIAGYFALPFAIAYLFAQHFPRCGGIWAVWDKDRLDKMRGSDEPQLLAGFPSARTRGRLRQEFSVMCLAPISACCRRCA